MADYNYDPSDQKLHCRYSQLVRCTPGQIDRVIAEMGGLARVETDDMAFGTLRHSQWAERALKTLRPHEPFGLDWPVSHVEHEFATEILPDVIVHSRPDLVCAGKNAILDYKTVVDGKHGWRHNIRQYHHKSKQQQLIFYAFQLGLHGILIRQGAFLCEVWSKDRDTILGYEVVQFPITLPDIAAALAWARPRIALLASVLEEQKSLV